MVGQRPAFSLSLPTLLQGPASWEGFSKEAHLSFPLGALVINAPPDPFKGWLLSRKSRLITHLMLTCVHTLGLVTPASYLRHMCLREVR